MKYLTVQLIANTTWQTTWKFAFPSLCVTSHSWTSSSMDMSADILTNDEVYKMQTQMSVFLKISSWFHLLWLISQLHWVPPISLVPWLSNCSTFKVTTDAVVNADGGLVVKLGTSFTPVAAQIEVKTTFSSHYFCLVWIVGELYRVKQSIRS